MFSCVLSNIRTIVLAIALGIGLIIAAIAIGLSVGLTQQKQTKSQATTTSTVTNNRTISETIGVTATTTITSTTVASTTEPNHTCQFIAQPPISTFTNEFYGSLPIHIADLDNDFLLDVLYSRENVLAIQLFLGYQNNSFKMHQAFVYKEIEDDDEEEVLLHALFVADLNHDRHLDLIFTYGWPVKMTISYGYGNGSFQDSDPISDRELSYGALLLFEDLNNDTYADLVIGLSDEKQIVVYFGRQNGSFSNVSNHELNINVYFWDIALADFNADGIVDLVYGSDGGKFIIHLGLGDGSFDLEQMHSTPFDEQLIRAVHCDLNGDEMIDIVFFHFGEPALVVMLNDGAGTFRNVAFDYIDTIDISHIKIGDMNHDNHPDMVVIHDYDRDKIGIYYGFGNGSFTALENIFFLEDRPLEQLEVGDFNGDHHLDLVAGDNEELIFLLNGC